MDNELCCTILADTMMANGIHSDSEIMVRKGATKTHGPQNRLNKFDFNKYLIRRTQNDTKNGHLCTSL